MKQQSILSVDDIVGCLEQTPFFKGGEQEALRALINASITRSVAPEEVIIHEGEYETSCYVPLSGHFRVLVTDQKLKIKREMALLGIGEILGEISALTGQARFAEVECVEASLVLQVEREVLLKFLDDSPVVKERVNADYRERILSSTLRRLEIFALIDDLSLKNLADAVTFRTLQKNDLIFSDGDEADAFYVIKEGFVKVSRNLEDGDSHFIDSRFDKGIDRPIGKKKEKNFIMAYLGPGSYVGERALFLGRKRNSNASAVTRLELLEIPQQEFLKLMRRHPQVESKMREYAAQRYEDQGAAVTNYADQEMLNWVESHDILAGESILLLDLDLCVRCLNCIDACAMIHHGVTRITHNGIRFRNILIPTSCRHCREPTCMIGCPTGAIQRDSHGEVFHTDACIGCGTCAKGCPFGNISMVEVDKVAGKRKFEERIAHWVVKTFKIFHREEYLIDGQRKSKRKAVKCDMCKGYDHRGCQHNCPTGAIMTVAPHEYFSAFKKHRQ